MTAPSKNLTSGHIFLAGMLIVLPLFYLPGSTDPIRMPRLLVLQICVLLGAILFLRSGGWRCFKPRLLVFLGLWIGYSGLSILVATNRAEALFEWARLLTFAQVFMISGFLFSRGQTRRILSVITMAGTVVALIGFFQVFRYDVSPFEQVFPPASTFLSKNVAGGFLTGILPLTTLYMALEKRRFWWLFAVLGNGLLYFFWMMSEARSSWVAILGGLMVFGLLPLFSKKYRQALTVLAPLRFLALFGVAMGFACLLLAQKVYIGVPIQTALGDEVGSLVRMGDYGNDNLDTVQIRFAMYLNSSRIISDHPLLGVGLGNFRIHYPRYHDRVRDTPSYSLTVNPEKLHGDLVQMAVETGLPGFVLFVVLFFLILTVPIPSDPEHAVIQLGFKLAILSILIENGFSFSLSMTTSAACFWIWSGFVAADQAPRNREGLDILGSLTTVFPNIVILYLYFLGVYSGVLLDRAQQALRHGDKPKAFSEMSKAAEVFPMDWVALDRLCNFAVNHEPNRKRVHELVSSFLKSNPYHPNGHYRMAAVLRTMSRPEDALESLEKAEIYAGPSWEISLLRGLAERDLDRIPESKAAFEHALALDPPDPALIQALLRGLETANER